MVAEFKMARETESGRHAKIDGFGACLRGERERRGYDLADISRITKVHLSYLDALENEDMARLPEPIYIKGFIKSYCSVLKMNPTPLIQYYQKQYEKSAEWEVINVEVFKPKSIGERILRMLSAIKRLLTGREGLPMG